MKKLKTDELLNKKSLFLLNNYYNNMHNKTTSFLSYLNNNLDNKKKKKVKKIYYFRNTNFLNHSKLQSYLLKVGHSSYDNNLNINIKKNTKIKFLKDYNSELEKIYSENSKRNTELRKKNIKILKEIFPNLSELSLYSNFPLYPFNDDEKKYNSKILIEKENKSRDIRKKIYNYYYKKSKVKNDKLNIMPNDIINFSDNDKEEKNKYGENNLNIKQWKFQNNNLSRKNIKFYFEQNLPLRITKINLLNNKLREQNKGSYLNKNSFINIFKNKEISKFFKTNKIFPNINHKKENNYYKSVIIKKNKSYINDSNKLVNDLDKNMNINNFSFSYQANEIQSIISRNKINSFKEINKKIYEDKGTETNEEN